MKVDLIMYARLEILKERRKVVVKRFLLIPLALLLAISLVAIGCPAEEEPPPPPPTDGEEPPPPPPPEIPSEILVGDTVSYTGPYAPFGFGAWGAETAVEDINKLGGVYVEEYGTRIPVRWITVDTGSDPLKVAALTEDLILRDKVNFLGMHLEVTTMRQGTAVMADKYGVPAVYGIGPLEPWLAMKEGAGAEWNYSWIWGFAMATPTAPGDFREGNDGYLFIPTSFAGLATFAEQTNKKMACFALGDPDGVGWYETYTAIAADQGYDCYRTDEQFGIYPMGTTDFSPLIEEWKDAGCEILWGNCPGPDYGIVLKQCKTLGFEPKLVFATRAAAYYRDITAWGGDLAEGVICELWFVRNPQTLGDRGIGDRTFESLGEDFYEASGEPLEMSGIAWEYMGAQMLFNAIEKAGTLDPDEVVEALRATDFMCMGGGRVMFETGTQFHRWPVSLGQWQKTDTPWVWEPHVVFSLNDVLVPTHELIFPKPWD
jgi:branched-chain amino acid transport system substrate-binding protein